MVVGAIVLFIFLNITLSLIMAFYNRKCPICGKKMHYCGDSTDGKGNVEAYYFYCNHCGYSESVTPSEMMQETH